MRKFVKASNRPINRNAIKLNLINYLLSNYECTVDGQDLSSVYERILDAERQGYSFTQIETWAYEEGLTLVEVLDMYENGEVFEDDWGGLVHETVDTCIWWCR